MDDFQYNCLLETFRKISRQAGLFFMDTASDTQPDSELLRKAAAVLKTTFGYESFRPLQKNVISNILEGRDTLAVMPTGGGKSLCYQIPALIYGGLTVVISPLIALMQDQVSQLKELGIKAAFLNSSQDYDEYVKTCSRIKKGELSLLYVAPERFSSEKMQELLHSSSKEINCITIDEAHCISEWGHDFRPDYLEIAKIRKQFPKAVCLALTATATARVRQDIVRLLELDNPEILISSFNRKNIYLEVRRKINALEQTVTYIREHEGQSGIIYCFSRKQVEDLCEKLNASGITASCYHGGMSDAQRTASQEDFIRDKVNVMVATVAFGMGINKPDVRYVIHYDMPRSIEQYYQEIGRAGRDGLPSSALLLFSQGDVHKIRWFMEENSSPEGSEELLKTMIRFAESRTCRRKILMEYFGESYIPEEENKCCCDICTEGPREEKNVTEPAWKFLSCILRTGERFGTGYITDVLTGSKNQRIYENGHNRISTYGIGRELSRNDWNELASCLIERGYVFRSSEYQVLYVTEEGRAALKNRDEIFLPVHFSEEKKIPKNKFILIKKPSSEFKTDDEESLLIEQELRKWRKKIAEELNVPPYVIFGDRTLFSIAENKPKKEAELLNCYGIGKSKTEKFGWNILRIVKNSLKNSSAN
ncbi:DNA helicase RecQ [Treponema sp.]|uniref:DNA helicase RecQ n=1 Tax=Treponema sp. TaxID=166 RepID=UPI00257D89E5|nr:DNA helicase RecQ [Treponema sp.]